MMEEEAELKPGQQMWQAANLETLSVEEMVRYQNELQAEIQRTQHEIDRRGLKRSAAEALFK